MWDFKVVKVKLFLSPLNGRIGPLNCVTYRTHQGAYILSIHTNLIISRDFIYLLSTPNLYLTIYHSNSCVSSRITATYALDEALHPCAQLPYYWHGVVAFIFKYIVQSRVYKQCFGIFLVCAYSSCVGLKWMTYLTGVWLGVHTWNSVKDSDPLPMCTPSPLGQQ